MIERGLFLTALLLIIGTLTYPYSLKAQSEDGSFTVARLKYRGGGDWYNDPSALENLLKFAQKRVPLSINTSFSDISLGSRELFNYPFAFLTGHGNISINQAEAQNLREYLNNGGFLYIDDDYGLDKYVHKLVDKVYPDKKFVELPFDHPIYHQVFDFPDGLPKVHEHDGDPPQGFGIFHEGRLVIFYTLESNLADGWTDQRVHNDPQAIREQALKMGVNILVYALTNQH